MNSPNASICCYRSDIHRFPARLERISGAERYTLWRVRYRGLCVGLLVAAFRDSWGYRPLALLSESRDDSNLPSYYYSCWSIEADSIRKVLDGAIEMMSFHERALMGVE